MKIRFCLIIFFFTFNLVFSQTKKTNTYNYDFNVPESLVINVFLMLKNTDYNEMLKITDLYEKKRVEKLLTEISNNPSILPLLRQESAKIKNFELINTETITNEGTNEYIIITTKWYMSNDSKNAKNSDFYNNIQDQINPEKAKKDTVVYVEYLLKKIDKKWKIISKRSK
ncbi:MAG: hypothetical protein N2258_02115 [Brevinematales bacterium]|nr:hypothetical protein [Brevinematales bacterium]